MTVNEKLKTIKRYYCDTNKLLVYIDVIILHKKKIMKSETVFMPKIEGRKEISPHSKIEFRRNGTYFKIKYKKDKITKRKNK